VGSPALQVVPGGARGRSLSRVGCLIACAYWDQAELIAFDDMLRADLGELVAAADRLKAVQVARVAADRRLRRAELEAEGRRWLNLVGVQRA
jgi:hypothetical protein